MCWLCTRSQTVSKVAPSVVCESCISPLGRRRRLYTRSGGLEENIVDTLLSGISLYPFSSLRCSEQRGRCYFFVRPLVLDWITISSIIIAVAAGVGVDVHHPGRRNTVPPCQARIAGPACSRQCSWPRSSCSEGVNRNIQGLHCD